MGTKSHCSLLAYINIQKELLPIETKQKSRIFSKLSDFYFDLRLSPPPPPPRRARQRRENPTPGATRMCESPGVARRGGWSVLELTDTLIRLDLQCLAWLMKNVMVIKAV